MITPQELLQLDDSEFNKEIAKLAGLQILNYPLGIWVLEPNSLIEYPLPDYANELSVAWELCEGLQRSIDSDGDELSGGVIYGKEYQTWEAWHKQAARALAMAWALWKLGDRS